MSGRSDPHDQRPSGELVRSKVERAHLSGPDDDLSLRPGVLQKLQTRVSSKKKRPAGPRKTGQSLQERRLPEASLALPAPQGPRTTRCDYCGSSTTGGSAGWNWLRSLCETCRARRNAFTQEQRVFRCVGCGDCAACRVAADCGACTACTARPRRGRCARRRCLRIIPKGAGCGLCAGCQATQDCGACRICERRGASGLQRQWKCLQRRCLRKQPMKKPQGPAAGKLPGPAVVAAPLAPALAPAVGPSRTPERSCRSRQSRRCGVCAACCRRKDCGLCDFCQDKPKFGGCNLKRQKCRWRQCLRFALKHLLPTARLDSPAAEGPALRRGRACQRKGTRSGGLQGQRVVTEALSRRLEKDRPVLMEGLGPGLSPPPGTGLVILQERGEAKPVSPAPSCNSLEECERPGLGPLISSPHHGVQAPGAASPPPPRVNRAQLQYSLKQKESSGKGEDEDETAKATTPVIMEIYSLSGATPVATGPCGGLDSVLQEFLKELNELPLPAHWEVLPQRGPDLCIIQRWPLSTVAAAVIHIQPGLYFQVVVQDVPVPPSHELYLGHPLRLTTVDEVVELIFDLEGYHLCPGIWQQGPRSPDCEVLVYEGRCQACCLEPYTSGSSRN